MNAPGDDDVAACWSCDGDVTWKTAAWESRETSIDAYGWVLCDQCVAAMTWEPHEEISVNSRLWTGRHFAVRGYLYKALAEPFYEPLLDHWGCQALTQDEGEEPRRMTVWFGSDPVTAWFGSDPVWNHNPNQDVSSGIVREEPP